MLNCKKCGSGQYIKNGMKGEKQRYQCKGCGASFTEGDLRSNPNRQELKVWAAELYVHRGMSLREIGLILDKS